MLMITNSQKKANQKYHELSPHRGQKGHHQDIYKQYMLDVGCEKPIPPTLLVGM